MDNNQLQEAIQGIRRIAKEEGPASAMATIQAHQHKYPPEIVQKIISEIQNMKRGGPLSLGGI